MTHVYYHAQSTARQFGGVPDDYIALHEWMDATKEHFCDFRHRALRHHAEGIFQAEGHFGTTVTNSDGKEVPVRLVLEMHCLEDMGRIPTIAEWLSEITPQPWMARGSTMKHHARRDEG